MRKPAIYLTAEAFFGLLLLIFAFKLEHWLFLPYLVFGIAVAVFRREDDEPLGLWQLLWQVPVVLFWPFFLLGALALFQSSDTEYDSAIVALRDVKLGPAVDKEV